MTHSRVGITTTIPVEILYAAGRVPVDLNNVFVADPEAGDFVSFAERKGFPQSTCAWTKGLYAAVHRLGIKEVVGVMEGDCSNTTALCEILESEGITIHPFCFPFSRRHDDIERELARFAGAMGTTLDKAEEWKIRLDEIRTLAGRLQEIAASGAVSSGDLFSGLLNTSDFFGDPEKCRSDLEELLRRYESAETDNSRIRLSCVGVPTILSNLWDLLETNGARVVDHEVPRQFALLDGIGKGLAETYRLFTYPYDVFARFDDVFSIAKSRGVRGILHYVQSFCHRQLTDRLWRERSPLPILTVEADRPGKVDERTRTRIEAFLERLSG